MTTKRKSRDALDVARFNLGVAQRVFDQEWRLWELEERELKEKKP